jgi:hypothetical protein
VKIGGGEMPGHESDRTRLAITVKAVADGEPIEVQIWLTVPQVASLVKQFFYDILFQGNDRRKTLFAKLLQRLLRKRWAVMTMPLLKQECGDGEPWFPSYHELEP